MGDESSSTWGDGVRSESTKNAKLNITNVIAKYFHRPRNFKKPGRAAKAVRKQPIEDKLAFVTKVDSIKRIKLNNVDIWQSLSIKVV